MGTTVTTELVHDGERRDRIGRRHLSATRRRALLTQFQQSGLTRWAFARQEGIRYTTFCGWVQREEEERERAKAVPAVRFAEVALPTAVGGGLEVRLPDGTTVRGQRAEELAALVRALRR